MRSAGQVVFVSRNSGMIVVHHVDGYAVVELIGDEGSLSVGDRVKGDWDALGGEPLFANDHTLDAYFQGSWGSRDAAVQIARNTGGG
ncbi:hypothetical protein EN828_28065 [Mesorhizobium sp. M2D.F.Ca.ET.185.01.1.1]|uniref:hypothetical protein n=1 Tax=unclassified Mesorhizobium TaxID=325217 RepID=UPI000FCA47EB|nr:MULTISPECIES: hypothetical protein [unclassified Mesorhizobium]TGP74251.1 hypothetical protein EN870_27715 [bacterium M00.F.Ca.ET.227.01.1.1]TGU04529.1 hypothetical protein EN806_39540 [bacterium M00.F.Ca.ET.163.01.1.1]TGU33870.1 hypothetical protein EN799_23210 [bacterium M00.F.Ca.ET.156.01.1.1]TGU43377.1 hypothetical protein EN789_28140 [bacterium M00.F.Ca.ET.146.01.1.1]TGV73289.1 hypothetical protein EN792_061730 [Mesorhizobium sp. M00.F.Ca.ET.149.01.1.1]TGW09048.1 hypothetical protein 